MHIRIQFDTDNAAFGDEPEEWAEEVSRVLRRIAETIVKKPVRMVIRDMNGNAIGTCEVVS